MSEEQDKQEPKYEQSVDEESIKDTESQDSQENESEEEKVAREREEYLAGWQRAQADMVNLKKRHEEERKMFTSLGKEQLLGDLVPMLDNFEAAFTNTEAWEAVDENWRKGIEYIYSQLQQTLAENGVDQFGVEGDAFDAQLHEPVESEGDGEKVTAVMQKGYKIGERVIRPAKVKLG